MADEFDQYKVAPADEFEQYKESATTDTPKSAGASGSWDPISTAKELGTGASEGAAQTVGNAVSGTAKLINKIPVVGNYLSPSEGITALDARVKERSTPENTTQQVGKTAEQVGEWMLPSGAEEHAGIMAGKYLPSLGKAIPVAAKLGTQAVESGLRNKVQGGDFETGAIVGAGTGAIGQAAKTVAPGIAESALNVTAKMRGHGRTVGDAILNETSGVAPITIARQAGAKLGDLTNQMESGVNGATQSGATVSTDAAHQVLDTAIAKAPRNAPTYTGKLNSLRSLLDFSGGAAGPQPRIFTPDDALEMKRGIDKEISSWEPQAKKSVEPIKHQLYRAIDQQLDSVIPGNDALNQRISSLIPAKQAAEKTATLASTPQKIAHRVMAHTGALAGAATGGIFGYNHGGLPSALIGGTLGLAAPEVIASPRGQMIGARVLNAPAIPLNLAKGAALQFDRSVNDADLEDKKTKK